MGGYGGIMWGEGIWGEKCGVMGGKEYGGRNEGNIREEGIWGQKWGVMGGDGGRNGGNRGGNMGV